MDYSLFKEQIDEKNFSQNYIFEGGSSFLENIKKEFINSVLNPNEDYNIQRQLEENTHPDLMIISPEKNNISIDKIRTMIEYVQKKPIESKSKLVIIEDAKYLRVESSNALLKTLEESFEYCIICIMVDSRYKLLSTILSRCIFVSENEFINTNNFDDYEKLLEILDLALKSDFTALYNKKNREYLLGLKEDKKFFTHLYDFFKEYYIFLEIGEIPKDKNLYRIFKNNKIELSKIEKILETIEVVKTNLYNNVNFQLSIEKIFITILN